MRTPAETLDRLDMHWIPEPVRSEVRMTMVDATTNGDLRIPLTKAWRSAERNGGEVLYVRELRRRVVRAVAHALERQDVLSDVTFLDAVSQEVPTSTQEIAEIMSPAEMRTFANSMGLPGDWYRNRFWPITLPISLRSSVEPALRNMITMQHADPRFRNHDDMTLWMEGDRQEKKDVKQLVRRAVQTSPDSGHEDVSPAQRLRSMREADSIIDDDDEAMLLPFSHDMRGLWRILSSRTGVEEDARLTGGGAGRIREAVTALCSEDHLTWCERIHACRTPRDFQALFTLLELGSDQWKDRAWLAAHHSTSDCGHMCFADLCFAINMRFGSHDTFIRWMEGRADTQAVVVQRIRTCETAEELQAVAHDIGIPGECWKSESWLLTRSGLSVKEGGVGRDLSWFAEAVADIPSRSVLSGNPSFKDAVHRMLGGLTHAGQAWDTVYRYCETFGMSLDELLRADQKRLIRKYPALQQAMDYLAESPNGEEF